MLTGSSAGAGAGDGDAGGGGTASTGGGTSGASAATAAASAGAASAAAGAAGGGGGGGGLVGLVGSGIRRGVEKVDSRVFDKGIHRSPTFCSANTIIRYRIPGITLKEWYNCSPSIFMVGIIKLNAEIERSASIYALKRGRKRKHPYLHLKSLVPDG